MGRASIRTKATRSTTASTSTANPTTRNPKKTARLARHAKFVSRIEKKSTPTAAATSSSSSFSSFSSTRRRRHQPQKKLISTLDSLADALPDINIAADSRTQLEGMLGASSKKALRSRPGAMKRKETLLRSECERFGKNLAILESGAAAAATTGASAPAGGSWAKLRSFIGATLERKEEFVEMERAAVAAMEVEE